MRVAIVHEPNGPFRLTDLPTPTPGPGEVLVRIHAAGLNPLDAKIRAGAAPHARHPLPAVQGLDLAGVVAAVGPDVSAFAEGDEVYGMTGGVGGLPGSLAEYAAVDVRLLAPKPRNFSMREAAVTPLIFITAWEGLVDRAAVQPGQLVLIQGGAGGVGHVAVQIARALGAEVFATASAADGQRVATLGATPIDRATPVEEYVARFTGGLGFALVYDTVGGAVLDASFAAVRRFGHVVSCLGWGAHSLAPLSMKGATYSGVFTLLPLLTGVGREHHGAILRRATELAEAETFRPILDPGRFILEIVDDAFTAMAASRGKVAVELAPSG